MRYPITFEQYQTYARNIRERSQALQARLHQRGWDLALSVGIHRDACCVHNASIDDDLKGWCLRNPHRLKVAKQANHILNDWTASRLGNRLIQRAWDFYQQRRSA